MPVYIIIGIICILYGIRFATRGQGLRSKPRVMVGIAMCFVGTAQFFRKPFWLGSMLMLIGVALFVAGLIMMRGQIRR